MKNNLIKCKVLVSKIFFPKTSPTPTGEWVSFSARVLETIDGEPVANKFGAIMFTGKSISLKAGKVLSVLAEPVDDPKYGLKYEIIYSYTNYFLDSDEKRRIFLETILSPIQADSLMKSFQNPITPLEKEDIEALSAVKGIGVITAKRLIQKFKENRDYGDAYLEMHKFGIATTTIKKISESMGGANLAVERIKKDPYCLITEVPGFGWKRADDIALKMGIEEEGVPRVGGFIRHTLNENSLSGSTYMSPQEIYDRIIEFLGAIKRERVAEALHFLHKEEVIWWNPEKTKIGLVDSYILECQIAHEIKRLLKAPSITPLRDLKEVIKEIEEENGWEFTDEQVQAVKNSIESNVSIITGGAGSGKSTLVSALLRCYPMVEFAQTALAGRAAARLAEVTGQEGITIHRLTGGVESGKFLRQKIVIVDEVSMIGGGLFYSLLKVIDEGTKVIMLGDIGQLESIGKLNVFNDLMESGIVTTSHLTKIHRQAEKSAIIVSSVMVKEQRQLFNSRFVGKEIRGQLKDLEVDIYSESILSQRKILDRFREFIRAGENPHDIQIIVPMKNRGDICTFVLNPLLKEIANPLGGTFDYVEVPHRRGDVDFSYKISIGDKVINTKNCYNTVSPDGQIIPIYNGNLGEVEDIMFDAESTYMTINFTGIGRVIVERENWINIELGYAITCHKFQGSQSKIIIIGLDSSAYTMLTKEWLYTAITRAQKYCVLCGENKAIYTAIQNTRVPYKQTLLKDMLNGEYCCGDLWKKNRNAMLDD